MSNPESTVLIVDDQPDYRITINTVLSQHFPNAKFLRADGAESAVALLKEQSNRTDVRLIIDGLEGDWKTMVTQALQFGIPNENMIVFSASDDIAQEAEAMGIQFRLKPESPDLISTVESIGHSLRL